MKIEIEVPDTMTADEIAIMQIGMQKETDKVIDKVYGWNKSFRDHLRMIREKTLCTWPVNTDVEELAHYFGLAPDGPCEMFHMLWHGKPFGVVDNDDD